MGLCAAAGSRCVRARVVPQAFQRSDFQHLALVGCFILPAAVMLPCWRTTRVSALQNINWLPIVVGIVVLFLAYPFYGRVY